MNQTFTEHTQILFGLFQKKGLKLPEENLIAMTLSDFYSIVREIWQDDLETRYVTSGVTWSTFSPEEQKNMTQFMSDYYYRYLQGNDTVT